MPNILFWNGSDATILIDSISWTYESYYYFYCCCCHAIQYSTGLHPQVLRLSEVDSLKEIFFFLSLYLQREYQIELNKGLQKPFDPV